MTKVVRKPEFVEQFSQHVGVSKKDAEQYVTGFLETLAKNLANGDKVQFLGFGDFEPRKREARKGRNPQTGEELEIAASVVPAFKPGKTLKDQVNGVVPPKESAKADSVAKSAKGKQQAKGGKKN